MAGRHPLEPASQSSSRTEYAEKLFLSLQHGVGGHVEVAHIKRRWELPEKHSALHVLKRYWRNILVSIDLVSSAVAYQHVGDVVKGRFNARLFPQPPQKHPMHSKSPLEMVAPHHPSQILTGREVRAKK